MKTLPPYLEPVDILDPNATEKIKRAGELSRALIAFDLICLEHGIFARQIQEAHLHREETRHRVGEACWHEITARKHTVEG